MKKEIYYKPQEKFGLALLRIIKGNEEFINPPSGVSLALGAVNKPLPSHEATWGSAGNATVFYCCTPTTPNYFWLNGLRCWLEVQKAYKCDLTHTCLLCFKCEWISRVEILAMFCFVASSNENVLQCRQKIKRIGSSILRFSFICLSFCLQWSKELTRQLTLRLLMLLSPHH